MQTKNNLEIIVIEGSYGFCTTKAKAKYWNIGVKEIGKDKPIEKKEYYTMEPIDGHWILLGYLTTPCTNKFIGVEHKEEAAYNRISKKIYDSVIQLWQINNISVKHVVDNTYDKFLKDIKQPFIYSDD